MPEPAIHPSTSGSMPAIVPSGPSAPAIVPSGPSLPAIVPGGLELEIE